MQKLIFEIIGLASAAYIFACVIVPPIKRFFRIKFAKPLDCALCSAWWGGLIYFWHYGDITAIFTAAIAAIAAATIETKLFK